MKDKVLRVASRRAQTAELALYDDQFRFGLRVGEFRFGRSMLWHETQRTATWYPGTRLFAILWNSIWGFRRRAALLRDGNGFIERQMTNEAGGEG
jgi:hypothetical protein